MNKYKLKTSDIKNGQGYWDSTLAEIYKIDDSGENKIGEFIRHYPNYTEDTFVPFIINNKEYALYSSNYTTIEIMELPSCKKVELTKESIEDLAHFCPVKAFIPKIVKCVDSNFVYNNFENIDISEFGDDFVEIYDMSFAFISGCVWGDDSSWKLNILDFTKLSEGKVSFLKGGDGNWLYIELPNIGCPLQDMIQIYEDSNDTSDTLNFYIDIPTIRRTALYLNKKDSNFEFKFRC